MNAVQYAKLLSPEAKAVYVETDPQQTRRLEEKWTKWGMGVPLVILTSPYRSLLTPLLEYIVTGIRTNIPYHLAALSDPDFIAGTYTTHFIDEHPQLVEQADGWAERQEPLRRLVRDPARIAAIAAAVAAST